MIAGRNAFVSLERRAGAAASLAHKQPQAAQAASALSRLLVGNPPSGTAPTGGCHTGGGWRGRGRGGANTWSSHFLNCCFLSPTLLCLQNSFQSFLNAGLISGSLSLVGDLVAQIFTSRSSQQVGAWRPGSCLVHMSAEADVSCKLPNFYRGASSCQPCLPRAGRVL